MQDGSVGRSLTGRLELVIGDRVLVRSPEISRPLLSERKQRVAAVVSCSRSGAGVTSDGSSGPSLELLKPVGRTAETGEVADSSGVSHES